MRAKPGYISLSQGDTAAAEHDLQLQRVPRVLYVQGIVRQLSQIRRIISRSLIQLSPYIPCKSRVSGIESVEEVHFSPNLKAVVDSTKKSVKPHF